MFVDIKGFKGAIEVENILRPYKRGEAKITLEVCREVLAATNFKRNIKDMLECVTKLPIEEQAGFREVVLSTFDNREQPNEVLILGKKLAAIGGYEVELGEAAKIKDGDYLKSAVNVDKWFVTSREDWHDKNLLAYGKMMFIGKAPNLLQATNLPEKLDFSRCDDVNLQECDLAPVKNLWFKAGAKVDLSWAEDLPAVLDVSMCDEVDLVRCDLAPVKKLRFKEGAKVDFSWANNLPENLDVSMCDEVEMLGCLLAPVKNLQFKEGAKINLGEAWNLSANVDVSMCSYVGLDHCNLAEMKELKFKEGARVNLSGADNLPAVLDVSMCDEANLYKCNLKEMKELRFKDKAQLEASRAIIPYNWSGKLVFADEESAVGKINAAGIAVMKEKMER